MPERGARPARREERAYREYSSDEQRRRTGCPARQMSAYFGLWTRGLRPQEARMNYLAFSASWILIMAVQFTCYFAIVYFAARLAIRHERNR